MIIKKKKIRNIEKYIPLKNMNNIRLIGIKITKTNVNKDRFKKFILSKSNIQKAIRNNYKPVIDKLENLDSILDEIFKEQTLNALFSYKMKIGIK